jgi:hypothetical protein
MARMDAKQVYDRLQQVQDQTKLNEALKWISNDNYRAQKAGLCSRSAASSGTWFLESTEFKSWLDGPERMLFCPGIPGGGKTVLTARAADNLERKISRSDNNENIAYVFCDYKTANERSAARALSSVLQQLVENNKLLAESILTLYETHVEAKTHPSIDELISAIKSTASLQTNVYLLIDAVDELPVAGRQRIQLLQAVQRLHLGAASIRILITSRPAPDIVKEFSNTPTLEIKAMGDDVKHYIEDRFEEFKAPLDDMFKTLIQDTVLSVARGM